MNLSLEQKLEILTLEIVKLRAGNGLELIPAATVRVDEDMIW